MYRRTRAALLALLVVLSIVSFPVSAMTAPSSVQGTGEADAIDSRTQTQVESDAELRSSDSFWQGWELSVDASRFIQEGENLEVWLVTEDGQLSQRVDTITADAEGTAVLATRSLQGRYVLRYDDQPVFVLDGQGYLNSPPDGSEVTINTSSFRVQRQTLTFEWTDPEVFPGQDTTLIASSNRDRSVVAVSAEGLSFQNLTNLFPRSAYASNHASRAAEDILLLELQSGHPIRLNTTELTPGTQRYVTRVVDTTASARPSLMVKSPAENRRFLSVEQREHVGDVLEVELACSSCHLVIGTPEQGVIDILELRDGNGDGRVTLHINTRYAAMDTGASGYPSNQPQYTSPTDTVNRYGPSTTLEQVERELDYAVNTAGKLRDRLGLRATGQLQPIEPQRLQLTVASTDFIIPRSAWGDQAPYGSEMVIRDETDAVSVELVPQSLDGMVTLSGPGDLDQSVESLRSNVSPRHLIALGDRLVFRIELSGVFGYLQAVGANVDSLQRNDGEGIDLALHRLGGNDERLLLQRVGVQFVPDPSNDALYVVFGTGNERLNYLDAGRYRLTLTLEGVSGTHDAYSTQGAFDGFPYLAPGASESISATATLEPPTAALSEPEPGISPRLSADGRLTFSGTATLAAGTSLFVHVSSTEFAWDTRTRVIVGDQGQWSTTIDLSDAPGESFDVTISDGDRVLTEGTYTVRPPAEEVTTDGSSNDGTPGGNGTADGGTPGAGGSPGGDGAAGDGAPGPSNGGGGSIIPGVSNLILFGSVFFLLMVALLVGRALM